MRKRRIVYLDNAATSFPKPEIVYKRMDYYMRHIGGSPGRSGHHLAIKANEMVYRTREKIKKFFNIPDSENIIFTNNATMAINLGLKGVLKRGDEVISSCIEHNSVCRPLSSMKIKTNCVPCSQKGEIDPDDIKKFINKNTRVIVINHASNVAGTIAPIREIGKISRDNGVVFFVDAAQSAGTIPIDVCKENIDMLACSGHKGLLGPQGTGILYIRKGLKLETLIEGGTGSHSESEIQPEEMPDRFESGTLNAVGIAGLEAGLDFIFKKGLDEIHKAKKNLTGKLLKKLSEIEQIKVYGTNDAEKTVPIVSFNIGSIDPSEVGYLLDKRFGIMTRVGLHCSPLAHKSIGSFPRGTVRVGLGYFNTEDDIQYLISCVKSVLKSILIKHSGARINHIRVVKGAFIL